MQANIQENMQENMQQENQQEQSQPQQEKQEKQKQTRKSYSSRKKTLKRSPQKLNRLYEGLNGFDIKRISGFGIKIEDMPQEHSTVYGELVDESIPVLYEIFQKYAPISKISSPYRNFYDLGSGIGKVVISMAYQNSLLKSTGVEVLAERIVQANTALSRLKDDSVRRRIEFLCLSIYDDSINYSNACWVYLSNLAFTYEVNDKIFIKLANELKKGSIVVSSKPCIYSNFDQINHTSLPTSWSNESKVYVYIKN